MKNVSKADKFKWSSVGLMFLNLILFLAGKFFKVSSSLAGAFSLAGLLDDGLSKSMQSSIDRAADGSASPAAAKLISNGVAWCLTIL